MSVSLMAAVWNSGLPKNQKMTLLAYADHANDDGSSVYPGEAWMADKTSDSPGNVRRVTKQLIDAGLLERTKSGHRGQRAEFRINVDALAAQIARHSAERKAAQEEPDRRAPTEESRAPGSGLARTQATPNISEPSTNHQEPSLAQQREENPATPRSKQERRTLARAAAGYQDALQDVDVEDLSRFIREWHSTPKALRHDTIVWSLLRACFWAENDMTEVAWGRTHKAAQAIVDAGGTPDEVARRSRIYTVKFPEAALTPTALSANWPHLGELTVVPTRKDVTRAQTRARTREALSAIEDRG